MQNSVYFEKYNNLLEVLRNQGVTSDVSLVYSKPNLIYTIPWSTKLMVPQQMILKRPTYK